MIKKRVSILFTTVCLSTSAFAANYYVSDELFTYTHSGPGTKYKIIGIVNAGEKIKIISTNEKAGYTQIVDSKDRKVWINSKYVSNQPGLKKQLEKLKNSYSKLDKNQITLEKELATNIDQVKELKKINSSLSKELKQVQEKNEKLNERLDKEQNELLMRWFTYGGIVAGAGLILGLILPYLIPNRKQKARW
ncbi:TIGR04211 family SH3 domain-containing protein [Halarcobacter sp.]|uniref:TIGR04211 family SH3 domain-containing protein n=1 Tax=Halarcobacter sp. TaxID=2321133 RepID=UPI0029F55C8F|nr:TIGR04211 family SH3 domain-containing protein [Halarcobacter sp.]